MFRMVKFFIFRLSVDGFLKFQSDEDSFFCFRYRLLHNAQSELKKIEKKKKTPKEGFILDLSELMRSVRIVSIARKLSL